MPDGAISIGALGRRLRRAEYIVAVVLFALVFGIVTGYKLIRIDQMRGDSAVYLQGVKNLASRGVLVSQAQESIVDYSPEVNQYLTTPVARIAEDPIPLFGTPAPDSERSLLLGHAYFILYPIALLVKAFPVQVVLLALFAFSFTAMVLLAYFMLRYNGVSIVCALLFCLLVMSQPAWWQGLLSGQFYPDRLFMLAGFVLMGLASVVPAPQNRRASRVGLFVAALLCALINERGALVAGIFLLLYALLYWKKPGLDRYYKLALGAALLCYGYAAIKFIVPSDTAYSTFLPTSLAGLEGVIQLPRFVPTVTLFLLVNAPFLCLTVFEWRAAIIALALMMPNVLGNIGGAEKLGWSTHYHTFYFPSLVWAALTGYVVLFEKAAAKKRLPALYSLTAAFIFFLAVLSPSAYSPMSVNLSNVATSFFPTALQQADEFVFHSEGRRSLEATADQIRRAVPPHTVVSSVEAGMPLLYQDRTIEFFPKDIDHADYAVLGAQKTAGKITYSGAISFLGPDEQRKLDELVLDRMRRDGYDVDHPLFFAPFNGLAVVRRIH